MTTVKTIIKKHETLTLKHRFWLLAKYVLNVELNPIAMVLLI